MFAQIPLPFRLLNATVCCIVWLSVAPAIALEGSNRSTDDIGFLHWTGGAEATFLDPQFHGVSDPSANLVLDTVQPGWQAAPRIWLGFETESGWGLRSRYWQLDAEKSGSLLLDPSSMETLDPQQQLEMYDIDLELTKRFDLQEWRLLGSLGGRYASLERRVGVNIFETNTPGFVALDFGNETNAGGLTAALEVVRPLGFGGWEVFGAFRASPMWGSNHSSLSLSQTSGGGSFDFSESSHAPANLMVWEAQAGLQCSKRLACMQGTVFARCAFEYQSWNWNSNGGSSDVIGFTLDPSVDLYGVSFAVGISR